MYGQFGNWLRVLTSDEPVLYFQRSFPPLRRRTRAGRGPHSPLLAPPPSGGAQMVISEAYEPLTALKSASLPAKTFELTIIPVVLRPRGQLDAMQNPILTGPTNLGRNAPDGPQGSDRLLTK